MCTKAFDKVYGKGDQKTSVRFESNKNLYDNLK